MTDWFHAVHFLNAVNLFVRLVKMVQYECGFQKLALVNTYLKAILHIKAQLRVSL
jgi:hypothetical protein